MWKCFIFPPVSILHSNVELQRNTFMYVVRQRLVTQLVLHIHEWHPSASNVVVCVNTIGVALVRERSKPFVMPSYVGTCAGLSNRVLHGQIPLYLLLIAFVWACSGHSDFVVESNANAVHVFSAFFCDTQHVPAACVQVDRSPAIVHRPNE